MIDFIKDCGFGETDLELFNKYVRMYGHPRAMPAETYLEEWFNQKSKYLLPIFGGQSIISEKISYATPTEAISKNIYRKIIEEDEYRDLVDDLIKIAEYATLTIPHDSLWSWDSDLSREEKRNFLCGDDFYMIIVNIFYDSRDFAKNSISKRRLDDKSSVVLKPSPYNRLTRAFSIRAGQKPFRLINNIVKEWYDIAAKENPERFSQEKKEALLKTIEKYRIIHSQILNTAKLGGTLNLSIHPMDYITASDNNSNWHSCMTWTRDEEPGEYRVGTLEMMNSPCVVVAYLDGDTPYYPCGESSPAWSNKKWREFFIVDRNFISGVKGYPYYSEELESIVIDKLSKLCERYGWPAFSREIQDSDENTITVGGHHINLYTDIMYNDPQYNGVRYVESTNVDGVSHGFNYSGTAYCLVCGEPLTGDTIEKDEEENRPYCEDCDEKYRCAKCGNRIVFLPGCYTEMDGQFFCNNCMTHCHICGSSMPCDKRSDINIITRCEVDDEVFHRYTRHMCPKCMNKYAKHLIKVDVTGTKIGEQVLWEWMPREFLTLSPSMPQDIITALDRAYRHDRFCGTPCDLTQYAT